VRNGFEEGKDHQREWLPYAVWGSATSSSDRRVVEPQNAGNVPELMGRSACITRWLRLTKCMRLTSMTSIAIRTLRRRGCSCPGLESRAGMRKAMGAPVVRLKTGPPRVHSRLKQLPSMKATG
jgi:hypothetical protein